ncbi:MAG: GAK system XXXCH domain-containing protein [Desulfococcaceae bacterium]
MSSGTKQFFGGLDEHGLAELFREMADRLEGKEPAGGQEFGVSPGEFFKLKLGVKRELDGYGVKLKVKPWQPREAPLGGPESAAISPESPTPASEGGLPKYKSLKKRMKGRFKSIYDRLLNDALPEAAVVEAFLADSKLMIAYPDYGDEFYGEYDTLCVGFREAFERGDLSACKSAVQELNRLKKECHDRYK